MTVKLHSPEQLLAIDGVRVAAANANIRYGDRNDMTLFELSAGSTTAAVFTQNKYCAAPVVVAKQHLQKSQPKALVINAGNANAGTGQKGLDNALQSCEYVAKELSIELEQVLPFSTGVIGEQLPIEKIKNGISDLSKNLAADNWLPAAESIMTTDTVAKGVSEQIELDGKTVTITGIAKGSGMICPNMATLLSYVATDAEIDAEDLNSLLVDGTEASFNRITIDSDTSTNDALVIVATGQSGVKIEKGSNQNSESFYAALEKVLIALATSVIRDGEGATKFVSIEVSGGLDQSDCQAVAYSIAHSPLVKTALFASDPNWGRILMAIGKADVVALEIEKIDIQINGQALIESGEPASSYSEVIGQEIFQQEEITISINLNLGESKHHVWTSDLSHEYVSINSDYRS